MFWNAILLFLVRTGTILQIAHEREREGVRGGGEQGEGEDISNQITATEYDHHDDLHVSW